MQKLPIHGSKTLRVVLMKFLHTGILLFLLLLQSGQASAATGLPSLWSQQYKSLPSKDFGLLSAFWAQAMVGAPEGHHYLAVMEGEGFEFHQTGVGIFEESVSLDKAFLQARVAPGLIAALEEEVAEHEVELRENASEWHTEEYAEIIEAWQQRKLGMKGGHVTAVANLLNGASPVGISRKGVIAAEIERVYDDEDVDDDLFYVQLVSNTGHSIDIINLSVLLTQPREVQNFLKCAATDNMLYVMAVGNDFPTPMYDMSGEGGAKPITVGSCAPTGYFSHFSRAGKQLTISAPSDDYILSIAAGTGELKPFRGTSGAAPLVSGALADVISIIPSLTFDEATHMLQKTAIATSINTLQEGSGVLNYYKLLRVAAKIQQTAAGDRQKIRKLIYDDTMYDFSTEAHQLKNTAQAEPEQAFFNLREAFFLDSSDMETRHLLAEMYRQAGYEAEALFYDDPVVSQQQKLVQTFAKYRRLLTDMAQTPIYDGNGFAEKFREYLALALRNPQSPELLEVLLRRLSLADLHAAQLSGDLAQDLQINPATLVMENPHLFAVLKHHQQRLLPPQ